VASDVWSDPLLPSFAGTSAYKVSWGFTGSQLFIVGGYDPSTGDAIDEVGRDATAWRARVSPLHN